jgi:hypothetical protein
MKKELIYLISILVFIVIGLVGCTTRTSYVPNKPYIPDNPNDSWNYTITLDSSKDFTIDNNSGYPVYKYSFNVSGDTFRINGTGDGKYSLYNLNIGIGHWYDISSDNTFDTEHGNQFDIGIPVDSWNNQSKLYIMY